MNKAIRKIAAGTACIRYIQRHASMPPQNWAVDTPAQCGEEIVHHERGGEPGDDHDLLDGGCAAAHVGRRDLRDIGRREHARRADRHAAADPRDQEQNMGMREALDERAAEKEQGGEHHHVAAAEQVGQSSREEGAYEAADEQGSDGEAEPVLAQPEGSPKTFLGAVDRAAVIAEQESADRRHRDDRRDETHIGPRRTCLGHLAPPLRAIRRTPVSLSLVVAVTAPMSRSKSRGSEARVRPGAPAGVESRGGRTRAAPPTIRG